MREGMMGEREREREGVCEIFRCEIFAKTVFRINFFSIFLRSGK